MEDFAAWYQRERSRVWAVAAALCGDVDAAVWRPPGSDRTRR